MNRPNRPHHDGDPVYLEWVDAPKPFRLGIIFWLFVSIFLWGLIGIVGLIAINLI